MRIGQGYDVHKFSEPKENSQITLGGTKIDYTCELIAHSDGDVLLHAITDAILGTLALGDIGTHFPDTDNEFKNVDSRILLIKAYQLIEDAGYELVNLDATIIAQTPKMAPHIKSMTANIAEDLKTQPQNISIKATTTEKLGFTGRKEGIAAQAIVLIQKKLTEIPS